MYVEREEIAGPDYQLTNPGIYKWASQLGSVYIGEEKIEVNRPRIRSRSKEIPLQSYQKLKRLEWFFGEEPNK